MSFTKPVHSTAPADIRRRKTVTLNVVLSGRHVTDFADLMESVERHLGRETTNTEIIRMALDALSREIPMIGPGSSSSRRVS